MVKCFSFLIAMVCCLDLSFGQNVQSGEYSFGLKLAYDKKTEKITGYFESYSGWDEETKSSKFSCIFYLEGEPKGPDFLISTYHPAYKSEHLIHGFVHVVENSSVQIKLQEEHGGCWNVFHFTDDSAKFELVEKMTWIQIRYIKVDTAYFFNDSLTKISLESYLEKGDVVYIEKIVSGRAFCTFFGKKEIVGWINLEDLNHF